VWDCPPTAALTVVLALCGTLRQTLDRVECNLSGTFDCGQAYVALSRASTLDGLRVVGLSRNVVRAHPAVQRFYQDIAWQARSHDKQQQQRQQNSAFDEFDDQELAEAAASGML
jgi:ATP-dependent DNA helicase PIF1